LEDVNLGLSNDANIDVYPNANDGDTWYLPSVCVDFVTVYTTGVPPIL
jgi:hypothetical protein